MRKMTKSSIRASSDDDLCINNGSSVELETSALGNLREGNLSLYSVAISFLKFLQWFFGILLCGPVQRVWWPAIFSSSPRYVPNKKPKTSRIFVIDSASSCDKILRSYCSNYPLKMNFLGVDCEWVNRKGQANAPVALLQLATPLCDCFLIRLCKMEGRMPQSVKELLEDKAILKFGVGIQDDVKRLSRMFGVKVLGCVDLRHVMQRCRLDEAGQQRNQKMSLDALAKRVLGVTMDKSWRIRCSNWEAQQFNTCQIEYAMNDALVASHIFLRLVKSKGEERTVDRTAFVSENSSSVEKEGLETQNGSLSFGVACVDDKASKQESWSKKCAADNIRPSSTVNLLESEKDEEGDNDSLSFEHVYVDDESGKQTESCLISETDNNKSDSAVNLSDSHLTGSSQISSFFLTEREPNIALSNENINIFEPDVKEDSEVFLESDNQGNSSDCVLLEGRESLLGEKDDDSRIDGEGFMVSVDAAELASGCYEVTADLKKLELEEAEGYLSKEDVINLLENPLFSQRASSLCQGVVDLAFKEKKKKATAKEKDNIKEYICEKNNRKPYKRMSPRKSPLYMNCMLAAPDGSRLCTLDRKKADWYIQKGIGKLTCLDPYTVQLNFEPSGRPGVEDSYYLNFKDNVCVVCGSDQSYMRKNIVPHDYRRYFPLVMKDHHSHDILLMCPECHYLSNYYDDRLRKELASKYDAPLGNATVARLVEDPELRKVKSAAKALNYAGDKLPEDRHQELSLIVQKFFKASVLTPDMISQAVTMETRKENANFVSHGREVVRRVREEGKLLEFEKMWRKHFVDTMRPQYLPPLWSVDHRHEGLKEKLQDCEEF